MDDPMTLAGRTIIVTGAAQGIGRAVVDHVLALGGAVAAIDRDLKEMQATDCLLPIACDVTDRNAVEDAVAQAAAQFGTVDGLVNNAGITRPAMIVRMPEADWQSVIDINLTGSFLVLQAVGRHMIDHAATPGERSIVNIASDAGRRGTVGQINYGAAKAGVIGMTMSAAREWARHGIRVNAVSFGVVETPMTETIRTDRYRDAYLAQIPLARFGAVMEVVPPVSFLLSRAAAYITGQTLSVNGGFHIAS